MIDALLVRTPAPNPTESMYGFLLRLSAANGYSLWQLLNYVGGRNAWATGPQLPLSGIAQALGLHQDRLRSVAYGEGPVRKPRLLGKEVRPHHLRLADPVLCVACVTKVGFIEAIWDSALMVCCPRHGSRPLDACPHCKRPLDWHRPDLLRCSCGSVLSGAGAACPGPLRSFMKIQAAMINGESAPPNPFGFPIADLMAMDLQSFMTTTLSLGRQSLLGKGRSASTDEFELVSEAVEVLQGWPNGLFGLLRTLGTRSSQRSKALGLRSQFAQFYQRVLCGHGARKNTGFIRKAFIEFGRLHWTHGFVSRKLLPEVERPKKTRVMSLADVGERLGVSHARLHEMIRSGRLAATKANSGNYERYLVDLTNVRPTLRRRLRAESIAGAPCS